MRTLIDLSRRGLPCIYSPVSTAVTCLLHKHTRRHARERWEPRVFDRASWGQWVKDGKDATARAAEVVDEIIAAPVANPLPPDVAAAVHAVVEEAERRVASG